MTPGLAPALERAGIPFRADEPLARHTTIGIGGRTPCFILPRSSVEVARTIELLGDAAVGWRTIGAGSNLLVVDGELDFAVISTEGLARPPEIDGTRIAIDAGYFLPRLARELAERGLRGLEFGIGVPGSIGGAIRMNAGAWGSEMSRIVSSVTAVRTHDGAVVEGPLTPQFGYRTSSVTPTTIVTRVVLELAAADPSDVLATVDRYLTERKRTQPTAARSAGCAFTNPAGDSAGRLVDVAGLKGRRHGAAEVSNLHGNFILNRGGATASDVRALIAEVKARVADQTGIDLHEEVVIWRRLDDGA